MPRQSCSTVSAFPQDARNFAALGGATRITPGTALPAPVGGVSALRRTEGGLSGSHAMLVDSHCHLDFPDFAEDLDGIVARAEAAGIGRIVTISTRVRRLAGLLAIAERFPNVYCSVGTHPHHADEEDGIPADELIELTKHPKVVALGEAGLDYFYEHGSPRGAGARLSRPYRRRPRHRPAAGDPYPRRR